MHLKMKLRFKDRVGIVADISALIAKRGLGIDMMEVVRKNDEAHVFVQIVNCRSQRDKQALFDTLERVDTLIDLRFINTLPQEVRANRFKVVLDNISDGVVSIDQNGCITTINRVAQRVLGCDSKKMIGRSIHELKLPDLTILECLNGRRFSRVKQNLITSTGRYHYFATGRPIRDSGNRIVGAVQIAKDMQEIKRLAQSISEPGRVSFSDIVGRNNRISEAIMVAEKIADTDAVISIRGESGTGKELFARAIHTASRRKGPFVPINCAALTDQLLESELFGYVGGAFTGGKKQGKAGLFEIAGDGTVFLDEIGEMSLNSQAKVLRLIQEKAVRRIGGAKEIALRARIITATNRNLEQRVAQKKFRQDLYYRINVLPIHIPSLAERPEDIPMLVNHFLFQLGTKLGKVLQAPNDEALRKLAQHNWPGNVRELKNVVERAAILSDGGKIDVNCIVFSHEYTTNSLSPAQICFEDGFECQSLKHLVGEYEKGIIASTVGNSKSVRGAARKLGMSHTALLKKMRKYEITVE